MRISTSEMHRQGVAAMLDQQAQLARTQQQLASGNRMLSAADDPAATATALALDHALSDLTQFRANGDVLRHRLSLEENALAGSADILARVRELLIQANTGAQSDASRQAIAAELATRRDQLVALANETDGAGRFLFGGSSNAAAPFAVTAGTTAYAGDQQQRMLAIGPGQDVADTDAGSEVFLRVRTGSGAVQDVFTTLQAAIDAVNDTNAATRGPALATAIDDVARAGEHVIDVRAAVGARLSSLDAADAQHDAAAQQLQQTLSELRDVDYAEGISRMNQQLTALQAAQQTYLKVQGLSLFDFLR